MMWKRLIVALDLADSEQALSLVRALQGEVGVFKVGLQLFTAYGPEIVTRIRELGGAVFLDLKLHDIPNTVRSAVQEAVRLEVSMLTLHTSGGERMLREAASVARRAEDSGSQTRLLGVTVLTSLGPADLAEMGIQRSLQDCVLERARLAAGAGLDGVVASPRETSVLRSAGLEDLLIVTPGIRPTGHSQDDQARIATPCEAIADGADYLVVGRPITAAADPVAAAREIRRDMQRGKISGS